MFAFLQFDDKNYVGLRSEMCHKIKRKVFCDEDVSYLTSSNTERQIYSVQTKSYVHRYGKTDAFAPNWKSLFAFTSSVGYEVPSYQSLISVDSKDAIIASLWLPW